MPLRLSTARLVLTSERPDDAAWFAELLTARGDGTVTEQQARERIEVMASRALVDAAWTTGHERLWCTTRPWNAASLRVAGRLGFEHHRTTTDAEGDVCWLVLDR